MVEDIVPKTWYVCHNNDDHIKEDQNKNKIPHTGDKESLDRCG